MNPVDFAAMLQAAIDAPTQPFLLRSDTQLIRRPGWLQLLTPSAPTSLNEVVMSQLTEAESEAVIEATKQQYTQLGLRLKWCVGPWTEPADFGARLELQGFESWAVRGMAKAVDPAASDARVRRVETESELDDFVAAAAEGWGVPAIELTEFFDSHRQAWASPEPGNELAFFSAMSRGEVLGTAVTVLRPGYAYLSGAQVLPRARGRGLYRALINARAGHAGQRGLHTLVTQAREASSAPRLERLGFETVFRSRCYVPESR